MERITIISTHYHMRYHAFSISLASFGGNLQRVTTRCRQTCKKKCILEFF